MLLFPILNVVDLLTVENSYDLSSLVSSFYKILGSVFCQLKSGIATLIALPWNHLNLSHKLSFLDDNLIDM
ncbi:hypothetical protein GJ496_003405 [Pomphorhynchus laevis]|nr:hypothetical protein GJ496_003405 [Pomphorhynchus laevis]